MIDVYKRISQEYDEAYSKAQELINEHNPCKIVPYGEDGVTCAAEDIERASGENIWMGSAQTTGQVCCHHCQHHSSNGCTVKCLGCKVSLCSKMKEHHENLVQELWRIGRSMLYPGYTLLIRDSKEEMMLRIRRYKKCKHYPSILCIYHATTDIVGYPCSNNSRDCVLVGKDAPKEALQRYRIVI